MIILTTGATRIGSRLMRPTDGPFETDPNAEERLVRAGVARYCGKEPVITPPVLHVEDEPGIDTADYAPVIEGDGESEGETYQPPYTESEIMLKTNKELEAIIAELGLALPKKATKTNMVKLIMDYYSIDGEAPPELGAEAPEV